MFPLTGRFQTERLCRALQASGTSVEGHLDNSLHIYTWLGVDLFFFALTSKCMFDVWFLFTKADFFTGEKKKIQILKQYFTSQKALV